MLIRLILMLSALLLAVSGLAYLFTRDGRYLLFAWRVVRFLAVFLLAFLVLYLLERYGLMAWGVLR